MFWQCIRKYGRAIIFCTEGHRGQIEKGHFLVAVTRAKMTGALRPKSRAPTAMAVGGRRLFRGLIIYNCTTMAEQGDGQRASHSSTDSNGIDLEPFLFPAAEPVANFSEPKEIGHYSIKADGSIHHCERSLLKVYFPRAASAINLRKCRSQDEYERTINSMQLYDVPGRFDNLSTWLQDQKQRKNREIWIPDERRGGNDRLQAEFVMRRGQMTKFLCMPYEKHGELAMVVTLFQGTWYISEVETEENRQQWRDMEYEALERIYWGYKFQQYCTKVDGESPPDTNMPVSLNKEAFYSVISTKLDSHSLLYRGEVDCRKGVSPDDYVELKTSSHWDPIKKQYGRKFYSFKLLKMWAQSSLVGIPEVICGFPDNEGKVSHVKSFCTKDMPKIAKRNGAEWESAVCFNFASQLLAYIKKTVTDDNPEVVYMLDRQKGAHQITCTLYKEGKRFLSDEYIDAFE